MLEIYLILIGILMPLGLAKHGRKGRRRKFRAYIRGGIDDIISFSGLGANTLVSAPVSDVVTESTWISSVVCNYSLNKWTPVAAAGPLLFGWAHSDYNDAEIEAYIEQSANWSVADLVSQEIAKRKIKIVGIINPAELATQSATFREGRMVTTKLNWMLHTGHNIDLWTYNTGTVAQITTTSVLQAHGHANLWPR